MKTSMLPGGTEPENSHHGPVRFPPVFVERYRQWLGSQLEHFLEACRRPLRKSFRTNTLKISCEQLETRARELGWQLAPVPWSPGGYWVDREVRLKPIGHSLEHFGGWIYVQEASSMVPVEVLKPFPGMTMLDLSAAPGGKTIHAGLMAQDKGIIIANDVSLDRIKSMVSNIERIGLLSVVVAQEHGTRYGRLLPNHFDRVLVDAPCSAEGTIRKDRTALDWWSLDWILRVSRIQKSLILSGYRALKPGGILVYSTCTLSPEENEEVVDLLIQKHPEAVVDQIELPGIQSLPGIAANHGEWRKRVMRIYPHLNDTEGFCVTCISKPYETPKKLGDDLRRRSRERLLSADERRKILRYFEHRYGWREDLFEGLEIAMIGQTLWVWNEGATRYFAALNVHRSGLRLVRALRSDAPKVSTWMAQRFGKEATRNVVRLSREDGELYAAGEDLQLRRAEREDCADGVVLVAADDIILGTGLLRGAFLKNQIPRSAVIPK